MLSCAHRTSTLRKGLGAMMLALGATVAAAPAHAVTVEGSNSSYQLEGGVADFGGGLHALGMPTGLPGATAGTPASLVSSATVTWDYSVADGQLVATAAVRGVLFYDSFDPGCARLIVEFKGLNGQNLAVRIIDTACPSPGDNANAAANQALVNVHFSSPLLHSVTVHTAQVVGSVVIPTASKSSHAPRQITREIKIDNGSTDFGRGTSLFGSPTDSARVVFTRTNGTMSARVTGTLYWDSLIVGGTARLICDFRAHGGQTIASSPADTLNAPGGNSNSAANKKAIDRSREDPRIFSVRVRVGQVINGEFVGVASRTVSFQ